MTSKESKFTLSDVKHLVSLAITGSAIYFGLTGQIAEMNAKMDRIIAIQQGVDNVQNLRIENLEKDVSRRNQQASIFLPQPALKPEPIRIKKEED